MIPEMTKGTLPHVNHWNRFWKADATERFTKVSWSKRRILQTIQPFVHQGKRALDAGCGSGFFSRYFCDAGMKTVSLDYSDQALQIAEKATSGQSKLLKKNLLSSDLSKEIEERFDLIFSDGLLEHFSREDQDRIYANFINLLSPGGVIATFVPNRWSPWELIRPFYMPGIEETPFVLSGLIDLHRRHHLSILAQGGLNTFPFAFSPDKLMGSWWGMLLYAIGKKID
ncbi:MAG: hypothetical protein A2Z81_09055 [Omnitrophica WOR_2 bacterium GWA2_45_18]|nr:MAG: hypothetical protein A2Z81_09055 [Omnitrophica WOR_2 bacterium GWA2_45_18]